MGDQPISYAWQWRRCDSNGADCQDLTGATSTSYTLTHDDVGSTVAVTVTATNPAGSTPSSTAPTDQILPSGLANTAQPTVATQPTPDGEDLVADPGSWSRASGTSYKYQWQHCDPNGQNCANITDASDSTYVPGEDDIGATIRVLVTASNSGDVGTASSQATPLIDAAAPGAGDAPVVTGVISSGSVLSASSGTWTGVGPLSIGYQWQRCDGSGQACTDISGATDSYYLLGRADLGNTVRVSVTATNASGSSTSVSSATSTVGTGSGDLSITAPPSITGVPAVGQTLSADPGTWSGNGTITYSYKWQTCDAAGQTCIDLLGATGQTYSPDHSDVGAFMRVIVTATDDTGVAYAAAIVSQSVADAQGPTNINLPTLSGSAQQGQQLSVSTGTWSGTAPTSYAYQWQRCDTEGTSCVSIEGATAASYTATRSDIGSTVRAIVTAATTQAWTFAQSAPSSVVVAATLENTVPPSISREALDGSTLTADAGVWNSSGEVSYAYQWQSCDPSGTQCADITGATDTTYALGDGDLGTALRVVVSATSDWGTRRMTSDPTAEVSIPQTPPVNTSPATVSGPPVDGQTLSADQGTWTGATPLSYDYQWQQCDQSGNACTDIDGATDSAYSLGDDDVGTTTRRRHGNQQPQLGHEHLRSDGDDRRFASQISPAIDGDSMQGYDLTADPGQTDGTAPTTYTYQWQRCDSTGQGCVDIPDATNDTYTPGASDVGYTIAIVITASNQAGSTTDTAPPTDVIAAAQPPANDVAPYIYGTTERGNVLSVGWTGAWTPDPTSYSYQWQRCDDAADQCQDIDGATDSSYTLGSSDVGWSIRAAVTATNPGGSTTAYSLPSASIASDPPPINRPRGSADSTKPEESVGPHQDPGSGARRCPTAISGRAAI